jgi:hypothetical protein
MPSTTIIAQPQQLMPAYNPIKYIIDNTNKNEPGFRYIFTIYSASASHIPANVVAQYKVLPEFSTGYGEQDISKLMQSLVTFDESGISASAPYNVSESWYQYDVDLGFEFIDNEFYSAALADLSGNVQITINSHPFIVGDQIIISQQSTGPADNPALEGLHTVLSVTANNFTVNVLFSTITNINANGDITYADNRKTITLDDELIIDKEVFNGAFNVFINNNDNNPFNSVAYLGTSGTLLMTSNIYDQPYAASTFVNALFYYNLRVYGGANYEVEWYDMDNNLLDNTTFTPAADGIYAVFVGPTALVAVGLYMCLYIMMLGFSAEPILLSPMTIDVLLMMQQLIYLDRMGSWISFAFQLKTYEKGQITREQYNQHIDGQVVSTEWVGVELQKGFRTYNTNVTKTFELNTNYMDQTDANRFQELLTSPQVYYYSVSSNKFCACIIENNTFEVFRQRNKNLIKQSVTIRLAQQDPVNG